jgi:microcystin-dependent protein
MSDPFIGEIRMFAGTREPIDWAFCQGQLLPISQYDALYALLGTTYGGDGINTFALPDLRGRIPVHQGSGYVLGQAGGAETVTLTTNQLPSHTHVPLAAGAATSNSPAGAFWADSPLTQYSTDTPNTTMNAAAVQAGGGSQPHENMSPYLAINFIIALVGIFPSQN